MMSKKIADEAQILPKIKVMAIGHGAIHAVNHMIDCGVLGVDFVAVHRDRYGLQSSKAPTKILIGEDRSVDLGTLLMPDCRKIAEEAREVIKSNLAGADIVFLVTCMGGNTGSGAASVVAACAREIGALTIAVITMPFTFEGVLRRRRAIFGVYELSKSADSIIAISDDSLLTVIHKETKIADAFHIADDTIRRCVQSVSDAINISGITNIKFSELKLLLSDAGYAKMGYGSAKGASGARNAAEAVINNSLMENTVAGGNGVFLSIIDGEDINLLDETAIIDVFAELTMPDATFI